MLTRTAIPVLCLLTLTGAPLPAAILSPQQAGAQDDWCRSEQWNNDRQVACEVRQFTASAAGMMAVDASPNGGIQVVGEMRSDARVLAKVTAQADSMQRAQQIVAAVTVNTSPDRISADGPSGLGRRESWSVSYRLAVPVVSSLSLKSVNGGISIRDVDGQIEFTTVNGGVKLANLAGDVKGRTSNGGVDVDLDGPNWKGEGLEVETSNGGVTLHVPEQYSAHLETGTANGGFNIDFPVTVQGRMDRQLSVDLGSGGAPIRVKTHNGGVRVAKK